MYSAQTTKDRIKSLCKEQKRNIEDLISECELGTNAIRQISDTKGMASVSLGKIADVLNCSVDYLLGRTENPKSYSSILSDQTDIDSQAEEFLRKFFKLSKENRDTILTLIDKLNKS